MPGIKLYIGIWLGLVLATVMEVVVRSLPGTVSTLVLIIMLIASAKAIAISLYYQHLKYEGIRLAALPIAAVIGIIFLAVSAAMTISMGM
ncbi:MAG TPA: cytochrome C oxidase subunit IV family protein [Candidatus Nanoarchaeia archaeon]|nr:cytochrome C oxidase subunit IV family protein [Candidatus Nanoarchaeia archaeon]